MFIQKTLKAVCRLFSRRPEAMVVFCMEKLKAEQISKVSLIAFTANDIGNAFWRRIGWTKREDLNYYDFVLNAENIPAFIKKGLYHIGRKSARAHAGRLTVNNRHILSILIFHTGCHTGCLILY